MFQWDKSLESLDISAEQLVQLFRSMRDVQLALPGIPAQEASAFLCQYQNGANVGTLVALHLHRSEQLAIYVDTPREVPAGNAERALDQALVFVESIGFLMNDLDIQLMSPSDRSLLWESFPLRKGAGVPGGSASAKKAPPVKPVATATPPAQKRPAIKSQDPFGMFTDLEAAPRQNAAADVDDLLAAVEALRNRRPGVRPRRKIPGPEELQRRRMELRATVGRILASL